MSAGGAFGGARGLQPRPPEKGVFPLDHFGECQEVNFSTQILAQIWHIGTASPLTVAFLSAVENTVSCLLEGKQQ